MIKKAVTEDELSVLDLKRRKFNCDLILLRNLSACNNFTFGQYLIKIKLNCEKILRSIQTVNEFYDFLAFRLILNWNKHKQNEPWKRRFSRSRRLPWW